MRTHCFFPWADFAGKSPSWGRSREPSKTVLKHSFSAPLSQLNRLCALVYHGTSTGDSYRPMASDYQPLPFRSCQRSVNCGRFVTLCYRRPTACQAKSGTAGTRAADNAFARHANGVSSSVRHVLLEVRRRVRSVELESVGGEGSGTSARCCDVAHRHDYMHCQSGKSIGLCGGVPHIFFFWLRPR